MKQAELDALNYTRVFSERELGLITNSVDYAKGNPQGLLVIICLSLFLSWSILS